MRREDPRAKTEETIQASSILRKVRGRPPHPLQKEYQSYHSNIDPINPANHSSARPLVALSFSPPWSQFQEVETTKPSNA